MADKTDDDLILGCFEVVGVEEKDDELVLGENHIIDIDHDYFAAGQAGQEDVEDEDEPVAGTSSGGSQVKLPSKQCHITKYLKSNSSVDLRHLPKYISAKDRAKAYPNIMHESGE